MEEAIRRQLEGPRDTTDDEAAINERVMRDMLGGLVDNQARMGAMGFGSSGALVGMDADIRSQAAAQALDEILGVRQDARDEAFRNNQAGIAADMPTGFDSGGIRPGG